MPTYSYTKILKFYKFRTFGVFYENMQYNLSLKNFNIKIQYQKFKEYMTNQNRQIGRQIVKFDFIALQ